MIKKCEKLPNNIKLSLEKSKNLEFDEDKLALYINECINIENNTKDINKVNESIKKCRNGDNIEIKFNLSSDFPGLMMFYLNILCPF